MRRGFRDGTADASGGNAVRCAPCDGDYDAAFAKFFYFPSWAPGEPCEVVQNIFVMLHGDYDEHFNFAKFGRMLNLPLTCIWSLGGTLDERGRTGRPKSDELDERRWMVSELEGADAPTRASQLAHASSAVRRALRTLRDERGWDLNRVHLFGFSDGGTVALDVAARMTGTERLGGCAVVAAAALEPASYERCDEAPTPVILIAGTLDAVVPAESVRETAAALVRRNPGCGAEVHEFDKEHAMVKSQPEAEALMRFWSKTLTLPRSNASDYGEDVIEVTSQSEHLY